MAEHGTGDMTKEVDKDHDEKMADALGTEADQAKRRALRQQRRDLKTKKRELKKQEMENKKKDFAKSLDRNAMNIQTAEYGTDGTMANGAVDFNHDKLLN